jgi:hypothetical protein
VNDLAVTLRWSQVFDEMTGRTVDLKLLSVSWAFDPSRVQLPPEVRRRIQAEVEAGGLLASWDLVDSGPPRNDAIYFSQVFTVIETAAIATWPEPLPGMVTVEGVEHEDFPLCGGIHYWSDRFNLTPAGDADRVVPEPDDEQGRPEPLAPLPEWLDGVNELLEETNR